MSLSGCTQEESLPDENGVEKENTSITDIRIEQVSLGSLENDDQIRNALAQLETVKKTTTSKNTPSNIYDFKVDTSNIKVINQGDIKSYTFLVKERTDSLYFDNLVLQQKYNGEPEAFLIRYYNENGIRRIPDHSSFTFEGKREIFVLDREKLNISAAKNDICFTITEAWCSHGPENHPAGEMCYIEAELIGDGRIYSVDYRVCVTSGSDGNQGYEGNPSQNDSGSGGGVGHSDPYIVTAPTNIELYDFDFKNFQSGILDTVERKYYNSNKNIRNNIDNYLIENNFNGIAALRAKEGLSLGKKLSLDYKQFNYGFGKDIFDDIGFFMLSNDWSEYAESEAKLLLAMGISAAKDGLKQRSGKIGGIDALEYTHVDTSFDNGKGTLYLLKNGIFIASYSSRRPLNPKDDFNSEPSLSYDNKFYYAFNPDSNDSGIKNGYSLGWYEVLIGQDEGIDTVDGVNTVIDAFWTGAKFVGRYVLPLEDAIILVDGKDWDDVEQSRAQTAGFMIVGFIPGGKVLKPVSKGTGKLWKVVIKNGDKVFTRTVKELTEETIQHFDNYVEGASDLLQEALRKGDILDGEIIIEIGQEIADLSAKKGRKLTWPEVKALFKRGQDFNKKAREIYRYNEVILKNGKRLDTYIPGQEIISRKATTLTNIKPETFKSYLQEIIDKYPKGAEINAPKYGDDFLNKTLSGDYYLEIPLSNKTFFENSTTFQQVLTQFNVDNDVLIRIKYLAE
ncbi:hypothetical protein [Maribacter luteus]|uniref:hypothetical protein n=1 Tax=Maribacter luteus TaxID=2594478 RepID=UPI002492736E|nr:hypothetical protein [Maribacter luteus]